MATIAKFTLNTGAKIPVIGFGTYGDKGSAARQMIIDALDAGYRSLDLSPIYGNLPEAGEAIRSWLSNTGTSREELFITSKVWPTRVREVAESLDDDLKDLGIDYVDMYLMHWPLVTDPDPSNNFGRLADTDWTYVDTWKAMEKLDKSKAKAIGVSNFTTVKLKKLLAATSVVPVVNQVETHPNLAQQPLVDFCLEHGIRPEAYAPLARGALDIPVLKEIASSHNADVGQVVLSWNVQRGVVVLPKSATPSRIKSNLKLLKLTDDEMDKINQWGRDNIKRLIDPSETIGTDIYDGNVDVKA